MPMSVLWKHLVMKPLRYVAVCSINTPKIYHKNDPSPSCNFPKYHLSWEGAAEAPSVFSPQMDPHMDPQLDAILIPCQCEVSAQAPGGRLYRAAIGGETIFQQNVAMAELCEMLDASLKVS